MIKQLAKFFCKQFGHPSLRTEEATFSCYMKEADNPEWSFMVKPIDVYTCSRCKEVVIIPSVEVADGIYWGNEISRVEQ